MESLNSYGSDGESDSSPNIPVSKKSSMGAEEIDANCEPITMDMSEDSSSSGHSGDVNNRVEKSEPKRCYSRSLSPSPPTSFSSRDSSPSSKKRRGRNERDRTIHSSSERSKFDPVKDKRYEDDRRRVDRHYKRDEDRDRRSRDDRRDRRRNRDKDSERYIKRHEKKQSYRSRSRSRSSSYSKHRSSKRKPKSRSRSRSYDRHSRKRSRSPKSSQRHHSPYRSKRSRSKSDSREKSKPYDWKSNSKLKVLEKLGIELKVPPGGIDISQSGVVSTASSNGAPLTPQLLLQKTMEEQVEKVKSATGISLPSYYNPIAVNPTKYAEQIQKRRLLWGNKDKQPQTQVNNGSSEENSGAPTTETKGSGTIWKGATFGGDQDGKMTAKFQRLMGIKNAGQGPTVTETKVDGSDLIKKQEEMFNSMESQYEVARLATHSHRGLGLGFGTFQPR